MFARGKTLSLACLLAAAAVAGGVRPAAAQDPAALMRLAEEAGARGLPTAPLVNKVREGLAKRHDPARIERVVREMTVRLETADRLLREFEPGAAGPGREGSVVLLSEAIGAGVSADEVRDLRKQSQAAGRAPGADAVAGASRALAAVKQAQLPVPEGSAMIAEAIRRGYRPQDVMALGLEIKRREADFRAGRLSLAALRDAIARGDRPEQLFPERPAAAAVERPAARPETVVDRPQRPERPQPTDRPQPPERPQRPERPETARPAR